MKNPQLQHLFVESESPMLALGIHIKTHKLIFMHSKYQLIIQVIHSFIDNDLSCT